MAPCPGMWARSWLLLPLILGVVKSSKLNVPRVLLPYSPTPPSFPLISESGCYTWSSTRPDVVQVKPDNVGCSSTAVIQALGSSGGKGSAMVMAEDKDTGLLLRADVIVDKIHSLRIVTKTHELYLEETPEKFEVRAYDVHGNEFSTLKGLKFRWTIESGGNAKGTEILRFMTWKDSPYNTEPILEKLENQGSQGNKVLLEGIKTGSAKVSVKLVDPQHTLVPPAVEPLMVVANLFLLPPAAFIIPCAALDYTANQFRGNRMIPVPLPSPNHNLMVPTELGALDKSLARVVGGADPASGLVELVDKNVAPGEIVKTPTADLTVVIPARLELSCLPYNSWTVLANREVVLRVNILDKEGNKVHLSDNLVIELAVDGKFFQVTSSLTNGTIHTGVPITPGQTKVSATLVGSGECTLSTPVTASANMEILADMSIVPQLTVLPWDPVTHFQYTVKHVLTGGDSPLTWSSSNTSISTTNQLGVSTVSGSLLGSNQVTVAMTRASHCQATALVQVDAAAKLALLESEQEFEIGSTLIVPLDLQDFAGTSFTSCSALPYDSTHTDAAFTSSIVPGKETCGEVEVDSSLVSHSKLTISWSYPTEIGEVVTLTDSKMMSSYSPLVPTSPSTGETVLAIDSDRNVAWVGGPQPWPLKPENYFKDLQIGDQTLVTVTPVTHTALHVYQVTCLAVGDTKISLTVGNKPSSSLPRPVKVTSSMTIHCSKPHTISLAPSIQGPSDISLPPCPLPAKQGRQAAQAYLDQKILVIIKDSSNRVIDSVSSVHVTWTVSSPNLGSVSEPGTLITDPEYIEEVAMVGPVYQKLVVMGLTGEVDITATIARDGGLLGSGSHSDTAMLDLVEDAVINPVAMDLFELETGTGVSVHGSGYFVLNQDKEGVEASYSPADRNVAVTPVGTGTTTVSLVDLCLSTKQPATMNVVVAGVASLVLQVKDKVQVGESIIATTTLLDSNNNPLPHSSLNHISLEITKDSDFVSIGSQGKSEDGSHQAQFPVEGMTLGQVTLTAHARYGDKLVTSKHVQVTVYPPLLLDPRNISLIIGAAFQFTHSGGPADCSVEFLIGDVNIASTSMEGIVTSSTLGTTSLTGRAVGKDGTVYSEDTVQVFVRPLSALQLMIPTKKVLVGSLVPVYLYGQDTDMNVYSYGSAMPLLNIDWSLTGPGYKPSLESPLLPAGLSLVSENNGVVVFRGTAIGKTTITATVSISSKIEGREQYQVDRDKTITISTSITVVDRLEILNVEPKAVCGGLLLSPNSQYQLQGNKAAQYSTGEGSQVTVTKKGMVSAGAKTGSAVVMARYMEGDRLEEIAVVVEIRPVQYLLARGAGDQWSGLELENLPKGGNLGLEISQHDSLGRRFDSGVVDLGNRPSRFDLIKLRPGGEVGSTDMKTVGKGWTVLRIWDKLSGKEAWLVTRVGEGIKGVTSLNIGDVADFDSTVSSLGEGKWVSEPAGILEVDPVTGVVVAKRTGHARVKFMAGGESVLVRQVISGKSEGVLVDKDVVLSSSDGDKLVGLVIGNGDTNLLSSKTVESVLPGDLYSCDVAWEDEMDISSVWVVGPVWQGDSWSCVFSPVGPGPLHPVDVRLAVLGVDTVLSYLPAVSVTHTSVEVGVEGGVIRVGGHSAVLDLLETRHSEGLLLGSPWLEEGELHIPVSLSAAHYPSHPTVTVSVPSTGQAVTVTVLPLVSSCRAPTGFMSALVSDLLVYYQSVLSIIVAIVLAVYITRTLLNKPPSPKPAPLPAQVTSPPPTKQPEQTQEAGSPYLWTVDNSPIYGSPIFRRSPPSQPRNLAQYSYN